MKKLLLFAAVIFASASYTQTEKESWFIDSGLEPSYTSKTTTPKYDGTKGSEAIVSTLKFIPSVNYFVIDSLAVGLGLEHINIKTKGVSDSKDMFTIVSNATYFFPLGASLAPFVGAKVSYVMASAGSSDTNEGDGLIFDGKAGIAYFASRGAATIGYVSYDSHSLKNKANSGAETQKEILGVGVGVALFF